MIFDISVAITWILFLALFPMVFFWLRRVWRIVVKKDFSEVALKGGLPPANAQKYAPYEAAINLVAGGIALATIGGIVPAHLNTRRGARLPAAPSGASSSRVSRSAAQLTHSPLANAKV